MKIDRRTCDSCEETKDQRVWDQVVVRKHDDTEDAYDFCVKCIAKLEQGLSYGLADLLILEKGDD